MTYTAVGKGETSLEGKSAPGKHLITIVMSPKHTNAKIHSCQKKGWGPLPLGRPKNRSAGDPSFNINKERNTLPQKLIPKLGQGLLRADVREIISDL